MSISSIFDGILSIGLFETFAVVLVKSGTSKLGPEKFIVEEKTFSTIINYINLKLHVESNGLDGSCFFV